MSYRAARINRLTAAARELAGNEVTGTATCVVPQDNGK
jgi:hypothetical protein